MEKVLLSTAKPIVEYSSTCPRDSTCKLMQPLLLLLSWFLVISRAQVVATTTAAQMATSTPTEQKVELSETADNSTYPTLDIMLLHFENLPGVLADGTSCSPFSFINVQCTMEMKITVEIGDDKPIMMGLGRVTSSSNKVDFTEANYSEWTNPYTISLGNKTYQGFNLSVEITSHNVSIDSWIHQFADESQLQGVSTYTSTRGGSMGTTLTVAWTTNNVFPPATPAPTEQTASTPTQTRTTPGGILYPKSCDDIKSDKTDGPKQIYINNTSIFVYCQFGADKAYTVIQSRGSGDNETFNKTFEEYKGPFGKLDGPNKNNNFWLGLDNMVALTADGGYDLLIELCCSGKSIQQQFYHNFTISAGDYILSAEAEVPKIGLDFISSNTGEKDINATFATYDNLKDDMLEGCDILRYYGNESTPILNKQTGGWWFGSCGNNLNGEFVPPNNSSCPADISQAGTTGIEMRTSQGMIGSEGRAFDGITYDRVRMAIYKSGSIPVVSSSFCS
ncbi:hypothetical protein RB195_001970 [Necator americanus]|uniref:Fibrinogen C-terminal domain-containing protein n=1 Tax=Necator americanus TaxID=51031 RepID=A0ABR1DHB5_NECAM